MVDQPPNTSNANTAPGGWRRVLLNRWLLAGIAAVVMYAMLGFLLTPWILKRYLINYTAENLKRKASMVELRVNPFLFTLEAKDFSLVESDDRPIIGFGRLFVDFELSSLFRWAWTFADIRIERPSIYVEIQHNGHLNMADLADSLPQSEDPPPSDDRPPRLLLQHVKVSDGSFTFSDLSDRTPAAATFSPVNLEFKEISTLPERTGPYAAKVELPGGGTVGWRGELALQPIFFEGELSMAGFKLSTAWKFIQDALRLTEPSGEVDFSTRYRFDYQNSSSSLVLQNAKFALKGLILTEKEKTSPFLSLEAIELDEMRFDLRARELMVPNIVVKNGKVEVSVDEKGLMNWQKLVTLRESTKVTAPNSGTATPESQPWLINTEMVNVVNVALDYRDSSRAAPLVLAIGGVNVVLNASAEVGAGPVKAIVDGLKVKLSPIMLSEAGDDNPLLWLDAFVLNDGRIDIGGRTITIAQVETTSGGTSVVRNKDGRIRLIELLAPGDKGLDEGDVVKASEKAQAENEPWSFRLDAFEMDNFRVGLQDDTVAPAIVYGLEDIHAAVKKVTNDGKTPVDFETEFKVAQGGSANVVGQVGQVGDYADVEAKITAINLKPLAPLVAKFTSLVLESGAFSVSADMKYRSTKPGPKLTADGSARLDEFKLNEADTGERLLEWKAMFADGIKFRMLPDRLEVDEVRVLEPGAKIVVFKDKSVNLAKALKRPDAAITDTELQSPQTSTPTVVSAKSEALFPINIDRVRVESGLVDFADFSVILPFATQVTDFKGSVTGISSEATSRASLKFDGRVDEYGLATVEGSLSPFMPKTFTDISVLFRNVEMKPLSPYSATFAGRKIASGKLNVNLEYKVENSELLGENEVVLERFTLGERVESPSAINLPLDFAIALLTDAEGKIDISVPVRGNVDDPEFKYGQVIWQAFVKLITKIVTAPFRALGALFGSDSEQMDAIAFNPGSARLLPPELEKLKAVSEALKKRPQLRLVVEGRFDTATDGEALRAERVRRALAEQIGVTLGPDEEPGPIAFDSTKTQEALEKLLEMRHGDSAIADFEEQYEKTTGTKPERANFAMALIGRASPDTAFYQAVFQELVKLEPLTDNDLGDLALRRTESILKDLKTTTGLDDTRVTAGSPGPTEKASTKTVETKFTLDVVKP
jgi:uncharacterized protein involved in outer membrane biogenesis